MNHNHNTIAKLVARVKKQDSQAFTELYELTYQKIYYIAFSILRDEFEAQDAVQEIYMRILSSIDSLKDNKLFIAWANRTAYTVCLRILSKKKDVVLEDPQITLMPDPSEQNNPLLHIVNDERAHELMQLIDSLPLELRATILFKYYEELKISEIAMIMDCPEGTVKSRLNNAKRILLRKIAKKGDGTILLRAFGFLPLRQILLSSSKNISMHPDAALEALINSLNKNNMNTHVHFSPQTITTVARTNTFSQIVLPLTGISAAAVLLASLFSSPKLISVSAPSAFTNQPVLIEVQVQSLGSLHEFYAISETGVKTDGVRSSDGLYTVMLEENDDYVLHAVGRNRRQATTEVTISCIDQELPIVTNFHLEDDKLLITLSDQGAGVDFTSAYGVYPNGSKLMPIAVDQKTSQVVFHVPDSDFRLFIDDLTGNQSINNVSVTWQ